MTYHTHLSFLYISVSLLLFSNRSFAQTATQAIYQVSPTDSTKTAQLWCFENGTAFYFQNSQKTVTDTLYWVFSKPDDHTLYFKDFQFFSGTKTYRDSLPGPQWTIHADSVRFLDGYQVTKATTAFRGRTYTAWYDESVGIKTGPWKLSGLPGLVRLAYSEDGFAYFYLRNLKQGTTAPASPALPLTSASYQDFTTDVKKWLEESNQEFMKSYNKGKKKNAKASAVKYNVNLIEKL
jgi:hypothetical protein